MNLTLTQLKELVRLVDQMVWDAIDGQLYKVERRARDYLAMKGKK